MTPNRWLHLRHPNGFTERQFAQFCAHCRVFAAYVEALLADWRAIGAGNYDPPEYNFGEPELSQDRRIASLPIGGDNTLGSRAIIENMSSQFLWRFFPPDFRAQLEEGLTEKALDHAGLETNWRPVPKIGLPYLEASSSPVV